MADDLPPRRLPSFTVVHTPRVAVRKEPDTKAQMVGSKAHGEVVHAQSVADGWVKLGAGQFMLIDGTGVGLSTLLEPQPITGSVTLHFARPDNGKPMLKAWLPFATTIKEVKKLVADATGLRANSMVLARGQMGQRISDSSENLFGDDETLWACGYVEGQVPGMMYLGEAANELNAEAQAGTLEVSL